MLLRSLAAILRLRTSLVAVALSVFSFWYFPQLRDVLLNQRTSAQLLAFFTLCVCVWSLPVLVSAANALPGFRRTLSRRLFVVPLMLALGPPAALGLGLLLTYQGVERCSSIGTTEELLACFHHPYRSAFLDTIPRDEVYEKIVAASSAQLLTLAILLAVSCIVVVASASTMLIWARRTRNFHLSQLHAPAPVFAGVTVSLALLAALLLCWAMAAPLSFTARLGEAAVIPLLWGGWVPILTFVSITFKRSAKWVAAGLVGGLFVASNLASDRLHEVRTLANVAGPVPRGERQVFLDDALKRWRERNGCIDKDAVCPPIILVAAEGGASRSAYFVASVLGALIDKTRDEPEVYRDFQNAVFAMSGVSGGALGVATARLALSQQNADRSPPCKSTDVDGTLPPDHPADATTRWRSCLQALTRGDYLSTTIIGLVRENFWLLFPEDRAAALERAIERHYAYTVGQPLSCGTPPRDGFCKPFGYLMAEAGADGPWLPLLILNATQVESGHPVLISDLRVETTRPCRTPTCDVFFPVAHNIFAILSADKRAQREPSADEVGDYLAPGLENASDLSMSTAVVLSARFPVISPAGAISSMIL